MPTVEVVRDVEVKWGKCCMQCEHVRSVDLDDPEFNVLCARMWRLIPAYGLCKYYKKRQPRRGWSSGGFLREDPNKIERHDIGDIIKWKTWE